MESTTKMTGGGGGGDWIAQVLHLEIFCKDELKGFHKASLFADSVICRDLLQHALSVCKGIDVLV